MEVIFLDNLIATVPFKVGDAAEEGDAQVLTNGVQLTQTTNRTSPATGSGPAAKNSEDLLFESLSRVEFINRSYQNKTRSKRNGEAG
jgi:hypothetical protein